MDHGSRPQARRQAHMRDYCFSQRSCDARDSSSLKLLTHRCCWIVRAAGRHCNHSHHHHIIQNPPQTSAPAKGSQPSESSDTSPRCPFRVGAAGSPTCTEQWSSGTSAPKQLIVANVRIRCARWFTPPAGCPDQALVPRSVTIHQGVSACQPCAQLYILLQLIGMNGGRSILAQQALCLVG